MNTNLRFACLFQLDQFPESFLIYPCFAKDTVTILPLLYVFRLYEVFLSFVNRPVLQHNFLQPHVNYFIFNVLS